MINQANINSVWASLIVEELIRQGINNFVISPGSRSTPLTMAVAENKEANQTIHFDERGAAFYALGQARATGFPSVLICTSGTAAANYFPAVIEASMASIPMIIMTADRPPELRNSGANQTIDQVELYGKYPRYFYDLQPPTTDLPANDLLEIIQIAIDYSRDSESGPVHINCMFREPLEPIDDGVNYEAYLARVNNSTEKNRLVEISKYKLKQIEKQSRKFSEQLAVDKSGLVLIGYLPEYQSKNNIIKLVNQLGWPVLCDITSGLSFSDEIKNKIRYYDQILLGDENSELLQTDSVLHLGGSFVSKRLLQYLDTNRPEEYIQIKAGAVSFDPNHQVTKRINCEPEIFAEVLLSELSDYKSDNKISDILKLNDQLDNQFNELLNENTPLTEAVVCRMISQQLPESNALFLASSMTIRQFDSYGVRSRLGIITGCNRGVSGIDGTLASAIGFAESLKQPLTLVIGDLAMLHDLNSVAMIKQSSQPITIVVLNNNGGRIFEQLTVSEYKETFEEYFVTPTKISFQNIAQMYDIDYYQTDSTNQFIENYKSATVSLQSSIIELTINPEISLTERNRLDKIIKTALNEKS